jgi:hypothetical protein
VGHVLRGRATAPAPTPGPADARHCLPVTTETPPVTDDDLGRSRLDCGRLETRKVRGKFLRQLMLGLVEGGQIVAPGVRIKGTMGRDSKAQ